jgi:hypothetical protein
MNEVVWRGEVAVPVTVTVSWEDEGSWAIKKADMDPGRIHEAIYEQCDVEIGELVAEDFERMQAEDEDEER